MHAGYENIVQIAALLEGIKTEDILKSWELILQDCMSEWKLDRGELVQLFGDTRDEWMSENLDDWLSPNKIYDGVVAPLTTAMDSADAEVYIVTTKQVRELLRTRSDQCSGVATRGQLHPVTAMPRVQRTDDKNFRRVAAASQRLLDLNI